MPRIRVKFSLYFNKAFNFFVVLGLDTVAGDTWFILNGGHLCLIRPVPIDYWVEMLAMLGLSATQDQRRNDTPTLESYRYLLGVVNIQWIVRELDQF